MVTVHKIVGVYFICVGPWLGLAGRVYERVEYLHNCINSGALNLLTAGDIGKHLNHHCQEGKLQLNLKGNLVYFVAEKWQPLSVLLFI